MRFVPLMAVLLLAACGKKEEVRHYTKVPKDPVWRILGAVLPAKDSTWFLKVTASSDRIPPAKKEILTFLRGLRFEEGKLRWTLPAGWQEEKGAANREGSFRFGDRDPRLEMTVVRLPGDGGGLLANLNRWREQLGLERAAESELGNQTQKLDGTQTEVLIVDLIGPLRPGGGPKAMSMPPPPDRPPVSGEPSLDNVRGMFSFELPQGWKENPRPDKQRIFEFQAEEGGKSALVTFTIMGGEGGGLAANIDRWRTQAGLETLGEQAVSRSATPMKFVGTEGWLTEAIGPERAIIGVIALSPQFSMFLKMDGPPSVVASQRGAFQRLAQSFQMKSRHE